MSCWKNHRLLPSPPKISFSRGPYDNALFFGAIHPFSSLLLCSFCSIEGNVVDVPGDLLDNVTDESGALAEVALGAGDAGLGLARGDLLYA